MSTEYVLFSRGINDQTVNELVATVNEISRRGEDVYLMLNSGGGNVHAGIHCYNMLMALPTTLTIHNIGHVDSVANVLFLAGSQRYATASSVFLFHGVSFTFNNPITLNAARFREHLDAVLADNNRIAGIIERHSALTLLQASKLFEEQRVNDAKWARDNEFIHDILDVELPNDRVLHTLN